MEIFDKDFLDSLLYDKYFNPEVGMRDRKFVDTENSRVETASNHIAVLDCDEVLFNINDKWFRNILNKVDFSKYGLSDEFMQEVKASALKIPTVNIRREFLLLSLFDFIPSERKEEFHLELDSIYFDDPNFYDDIPLTIFGEGIVTLLENTHNLNTIYVLSKVRHNSDAATASKIKHLDKFFGPFKTKFTIKYVFIERHQSKADWLNANLPIFNLYVDDSFVNIKEVLTKCEQTSYEVYVPNYGYNVEATIMSDQEVARAIVDKNLTLKTFHNMTEMSQEDFSSYMSHILLAEDPLSLNK